MKEEREHELLELWLRKEITLEELKKEMPTELVVRYQQIIGTVDTFVPDNSDWVFDPNEILKQKKIIEVRKTQWWTPVSVAASIALFLLAGWFFLRSERVEYETLAGQKLELKLPDGTKVYLAPNSKISWDEEEMALRKRKIKFKGKGYFDVTKKGDFKILTEVGEISVLGTRFEIVEYEENLTVSCFEGRVGISIDQNQLEIGAGQLARNFLGKWERLEEIEVTRPDWLRGLLRFRNAPLLEVLSQLSAQYGLVFDTQAINTNRRFTGSLPDTSQDVALKLLFESLEIYYQIEGKQVILSE